MDKDIERLGRERLNRQKNKKAWFSMLLALAVVVLGITAYKLIQPASAADQNTAEFEVDDVKDTYSNLGKLSFTPVSTIDAKSENTWDGENFNIAVDLDFAITKDEAASAGLNYYYVFSDSVYISEKLCSKWYEHQDKNGNDAFTYHFIKTEEGKYAVLIKFVDGYLSEDVSGGIMFYCSAKGKVDDKGDVTVDIGGEAYITVESTQIVWDKNTSVNYDIKVEKVNNTNNEVATDENGRKYAEYTLNISSSKGTPDIVSINDVFSGHGITVDTSNPVMKLYNQYGQEVSYNLYGASVVADSSDPSKFNLTATIPKLEAGQSYKLVYRYYLDVSNCGTNSITNIDNNVNISSEDKITHEKVVDYSSSQLTYKRSVISKTGEYKNGEIIWNVRINDGNENIINKVFTDTMLSVAYDLQVKYADGSEAAGYRVNKNADGSIRDIKFTAIKNGVNTNAYVITYKTKAEPSFANYKVTNKSEFDGGKVEYSVDVPAAAGVNKSLVSATDDSTNHKYIMTWKSTINVPSTGIPKGTVIKDELSDGAGQQNHYMTYEQIDDLFRSIYFTYYDAVSNYKVVALDGKTYSWYAVNSSSFAGYTAFSFEFVQDVPTTNSGVIEFTYSSTGDYSSGIDTNYKNAFTAGTVTAWADYSKKSNVKKMDKDFQTGITKKTGDEAGNVRWVVEINLDSNSTMYKIVDTMPQGVTVNKVGVEMAYHNGNIINTPLDGSLVEVYDIGNNYFNAGISAKSTLANENGTSVITTEVNKIANCNGWYENSKMYIYYDCTIDGYLEAADLTEFTLKNKVSVSTNTTDKYGESNQTQIISKPQKSSSEEEKHESGSAVLDKKYSWNNTEHILNYTVSINPYSKDLVTNCDTLALEDVLTYAKNTYDGAHNVWEIHIIPTSVALYYAELKDDGTLRSTGEKVTDWNWTYEEGAVPDVWETYYDKISGNIPDGRAMILKYSYAVNLVSATNAWGTSKMDITNKVNLQGVSSADDSSHTKDEFTDEGTSAYIYKNNEYIFYKVESGNYGNVLSGAEFTVYKYDPNSSSNKKTADGYVPYKTYYTDLDGSFKIDFELKNYTYNHQYYIVETKAPDGYLLPQNPEKYYFYYQAENVAKYPVMAPGKTLTGKDLSDGYFVEFVEDERIPTTSLAVRKYWHDSKGQLIKRTQGSIFLQVYQVQQDNTSKPYGNVVEIKADKDGDWYYSIKDLPKYKLDSKGNLTSYRYKYFVKEIGVDENYTVSGYSVSYVYTDADGTGFVVGDGKDTSQGVESGTVEITNKEISYDLPATGGSGNRWIYNISGLILTLFAGITLLYKRNKLKL